MTYTPTASEITRVRLLTGETDAASEWTDARISEILILRNGDVYTAAADIWTYKAADLAANPDKFSVDGGTYEFTQAYDRCLAEAARCQSMSDTNKGMIIDPTLGRIE